eukprot:CAMPEP_0181217990 /NCGR_PEP_ID=MMETSP1096-20121128/27448_1 /TAXON_ID=156174 ORGANISM="Chrysochromulina ericina, Strain CCMP281" /NCGR_SAMPLE_ID=MMETSP1096 /ASSEMBLY_ACC=CAM_ASM_000453 /LENGTH=89 /DNA_ID=CAMNT_0023310163 /DNA_START=27 /DNA_END=295 /DNA_ORIENTATION=+
MPPPAPPALERVGSLPPIDEVGGLRVPTSMSEAMSIFASLKNRVTSPPSSGASTPTLSSPKYPTPTSSALALEWYVDRQQQLEYQRADP